MSIYIFNKNLFKISAKITKLPLDIQREFWYSIKAPVRYTWAYYAMKREIARKAR